jgi:hypothetical protein
VWERASTSGSGPPTEVLTTTQPFEFGFAAAPSTSLQRRSADFVALMTDGLFIFMPTSQLWPPPSINARLPWIKRPSMEPISPASWLRRTRPVEQWTWVPGAPQIVRHRLLVEGGCVEHEGATVFTQYKPPTITPGDAAQAERWCDLVRKFWPDDAEHLFDCFAHRVQAAP